MSSLRVAVVGATGAVGPEVLKVLEERRFPASEVVPFASSRSAGTRVSFAGEQLEVRELTEDSLAGFDLALFSAGGSTSKAFAPAAVKRGCVVVDKSSAYRMDPDVPLVVPEVNPESADAHSGIVANPNCSTIQFVAALAPLRRAAGLRHVTVATYQAVSGTGTKAIDELTAQSRAVLAGEPAEPSVYPHPIAFNALPHCDSFDAEGTPARRQSSSARRARSWACPIWASPPPACACPSGAATPRRCGSRPSSRSAPPRRASCSAAAPGLVVVDDPSANEYPTPAETAGRDEVFVGRIRNDPSRPNGLALWIVADNLRKGAATNGVQIAEPLVERGLVRVPGAAAA